MAKKAIGMKVICSESVARSSFLTHMYIKRKIQTWLWVQNFFSEDLKRAERAYERSEHTSRASDKAAGGLGGRCKPPNGVLGRSPGKFWDIRTSKWLEISVLKTFYGYSRLDFCWKDTHQNGFCQWMFEAELLPGLENSNQSTMVGHFFRNTI